MTAPIYIVGEVACDGVQVVADRYVPAIRWLPRRHPALFLYAEGCGGFVELWVEAATGALTEVAVIREPRSLAADPAGQWRPDSAGFDTRPLLDRVMWGLGPDDDVNRHDLFPVHVDAPQLGVFHGDDGRMTLRFAETPVAYWMRSGDVGVGVSAGGTLVVVTAVMPALDEPGPNPAARGRNRP